MTENTHQIFCERADELVSYLYGEASAAEKSLFELHLADCAACASEMSDFSLVRSSIVEWRDTAFQPLTTPFIQLPSINKANLAAETSNSGSLLTRIRALFALSPAWTGVAAVAALVICAGLWFVATNFQQTDDIAQIEKDRNKGTISSPTHENIAELKTVNSEETETVSEEPSKPPIIETKEIKSKKENGAVKVSQPGTVQPKRVESEKSVKSTKPVLKKSNQSPPPTLLADDDDSEDDSLRLSDLFKEVGS